MLEDDDVAFEFENRTHLLHREIVDSPHGRAVLAAPHDADRWTTVHRDARFELLTKTRVGSEVATWRAFAMQRHEWQRAAQHHAFSICGPLVRINSQQAEERALGPGRAIDGQEARA